MLHLFLIYKHMKAKILIACIRITAHVVGVCIMTMLWPVGGQINLHFIVL